MDARESLLCNTCHVVFKKERITIQLHVVQVPNHKKIIKKIKYFSFSKTAGGLWAVGVYGAGVVGDFVALLM